MSADGTQSTLSTHARNKYLPKSKVERQGIALALSGGGYRAALFHLGALRRLNELGVLEQITTFTSVSGGSVISGLLASALRWPLDGPVTVDEWDTAVARPMRLLASRNIRALPFIKTWTSDWFKTGTGAAALAAKLEPTLTRMPLSKLPNHPKFIFCATDMAVGVDWGFENTRMGDKKVGFVSTEKRTLAAAVATSAAFPVILGRMPIRIPASHFNDGELEGDDKTKALTRLTLVDGGNFDNLALERVWTTHEVVLSSDGGDAFNIEEDSGWLRRVLRHIWILYNQSIDLRKRWLISNFASHVLEGSYWGIGSAASSYKESWNQGYSKDLAARRISQIRTDFDVFSDAEIAVLENHGYVLADAAIRAHQPNLVRKDVELKIPHQSWMIDEKIIDKELKESSKYRIPFGRFK
jgi:NTE family protein